MLKERATLFYGMMTTCNHYTCTCCRDGGYEAHEDQQRAEYAKQIQTKTRESMGQPLPRELCWKDARNITLKRHFSALMYPVTARNDEVLIVKAFNGAAADGAILGVELKKKLTRQVTHNLNLFLASITHSTICKLLPVRGCAACATDAQCRSSCTIRKAAGS
jgi:hypothetical protein